MTNRRVKKPNWSVKLRRLGRKSELENLQKKQDDQDKFNRLAIIPEEEKFDIDKHTQIALDKIKEIGDKLKNIQDKMEKLNSKLKWMIYREQKYQESFGRVSNN